MPIIGYSHFSIHKEVLEIIKIRSLKEIYKASHLPMEVQDEIIRVVEILDDNYNNINIDGGYIVILESGEEVDYFVGKPYADLGIGVEDYEFADKIETESTDDYVSILYLIGTEYSVTVIMPLKAAPKNIKNLFKDGR